MKFRKTKIFTGAVFEVPNHIVRVDCRSGHGWQVRYGPRPWITIADHTPDGSGAEDSLRLATAELAKRINKHQSPTNLRTVIMHHKKSDLPIGISGPRRRVLKGRRIAFYEFQVSLPVGSGKTKNGRVYVGTENTMTDERFQEAISKAVAMREEYIKNFQKAATKEKREKAVAAGVVSKK